jgi:hypothetical protein
MTKHCVWEKNQATLEGTVILYNRKYIQTSKTETRKKDIRFYYALSEGKDAPTVPSDQSVYQALWDNPERSNRSLKRKAPPQQAEMPIQAKKSKPLTSTWKTASSTGAAPQETASDNAMPSLPPISFEEAHNMVQEAWNKVFPKLRFPVEMIAFFPATKFKLPLFAAPHERNQERSAFTHQSTKDPSRSKVEINKNLESQFLKERAFFASLKKILNSGSNQLTPHTRHLLATFAASHPHISVIYQEMLNALARYKLLLEIKAGLEFSGKAKGMDLSFINLENVANSSPSATTFTNWVVEMARDQYLIFGCKIENSNKFCQSDGGQKGQEVRHFTSFDPLDNE